MRRRNIANQPRTAGMNWLCLTRFALIALVLLASANLALADPPDLLRNYFFLPTKTTVHVSGGTQGYNMNLTIAGRFGLVTGYDETIDPISHAPTLVPHAEFVDVHGILYNPLSLAPFPVPGWDVDKTLNLSGLKGTFNGGDQNHLFFLGGDGAGVAEILTADITGPWLHLTGGSSDPPSSTSVLYRVDALAHLAPFPDFNRDGQLTSADVPMMLSALGDLNTFKSNPYLGDASSSLLSMADMNGDGALTNADVQSFLTLLKTGGDSLTTVPEPSSLALAFCGAAAIIGLLQQQSHRCNRAS